MTLFSEHFRLALKIEKEVNTVKIEDEFWKAADIANFCRCSMSHAYKIMGTINKERKAQGLIVIHGRIPKSTVLKRLGVGLA
jgi:hypothetical protein